MSADDHVKNWLEERVKNEEEMTVAGFDDYTYSPEVTEANAEQLNIENITDRRIFFELTGYKINKDDDFEEEEIPHDEAEGV